MQRVTLGRSAREESNLKFPHALHLDPRGGAAQMGRRLAADHGFGESLQCADCHVPTPDGTRFQPVDMEEDCGMCHSLAFDQLGGTIRTLRHGSPAQVIGDLRALYRAGGPQRPAALSAGARERPGDVNQIRAAIQFARARAGVGDARRPGDPRRLLARAAPASTATKWSGRRPDRSTTGSGRSPSRPATCCTAGSITAPTRSSSVRASRAPRARPPAPAATPRWRSNAATDLLLPDLASCRACHGGETTGRPVASTCAMCHDFHMDGGTPAMLLRQRVRGRRWETTVIPVHPQPQPAAAGGR